MHRSPMTRTTIVAAALVLAIPTLVGAQEELREPQSIGEGLVSAVVTNALDPSTVNAEVVATARTAHLDMDGLVAGKRAGWNERGPGRDTEEVAAAVLELLNAEQPPNVISVSGGDNQENVEIARQFQSTHIIDLNQTLPCVTEQGLPDDTGVCAGQEFGVSPFYTAVEFAVEEPAFLAGIVAAKAAFGEGLGIISGSRDCDECSRYVAGFLRGARSVDPEIDVEVAYMADNERDGFSDPETARTFAEAFIDVYQPGVVLAVGRGATRGIVEAACDAGIQAVATGMDMRAVYPELTCTLASVHPDLEGALRDQLTAFSYGDLSQRRLATYDLDNGGVVISGDWRATNLPVDTEPTYAAAEAGLLDGSIEACDETCRLGPELSSVLE